MPLNWTEKPSPRMPRLKEPRVTVKGFLHDFSFFSTGSTVCPKATSCPALAQSVLVLSVKESVTASSSPGAVSCKKKDTGAENAGQGDQSTETGAASDSSEKKDNNGSASAEVTEENFRSFPVTDESMFYVGDAEGGVAISGCKAELKDKVIVVPEKISGSEVVAVSMGAFKENEDVVAIVLPDTVKKIEGTSFLDCGNLKYVYFGSGLKETGDMIFNFCKNIEKVEFPDGIEKIGGLIAFNCTSLKEIVIPASATDIPSGIMPSDGFDGVIKTPAGSKAEKVALEYGLKVENY